MNSRTRKIAALCIVLVVGSGLAGLNARSASAEKAEPTETNKSRSFLNDPNFASSPQISLGSKELFAKMAVSIGLVAALGVAAVYLSKKVLPKVARGPGKEIHVLETAYLGPRKAVHLVEVGHQKLLIGSTNEHITTLAHVGETWLDISRQDIDETVNT